MSECWVDVVGYEGLYKVNPNGDVLSMRTGKLMVAVEDKYGYLNVCLTKDKKSLSKKVHRLVANAFILNPENKEQVNHLDENKLNNRVDNLEWVSAKENLNYGTRNERVSISKRNTNCKKVLQLDLDGNLIKEWESFCEINRQKGYDTGLLVKVCKGVKQTAYGYRWSYSTINGGEK